MYSDAYYEKLRRTKREKFSLVRVSEHWIFLLLARPPGPPSPYWCCFLCRSISHTIATGRYHWHIREVLAWFDPSAWSWPYLNNQCHLRALAIQIGLLWLKSLEKRVSLPYPKGISLSFIKNGQMRFAMHTINVKRAGFYERFSRILWKRWRC